jgi:hypothetical protein
MKPKSFSIKEVGFKIGNYYRKEFRVRGDTAGD